MRCMHCQEPIVLHEVGQRYCRECARRIKYQEETDAERRARFRNRFPSVRAKDLTPVA